jgi:catechol 2,3-dioxygenase-like lactoylglutathione lyase family enzyme
VYKLEQTKFIDELTLGIPVDHLQEAISWYQHYLGCELIQPLYGYADMRLGKNQKILLFIPDDGVFFAGPSYKENPHYLLRLLVNDIEEFHRFLTSSGVEAGEIVGEEGAALGRSFIFSDPYRNRLLAWTGFHCDPSKDLLKDL